MYFAGLDQATKAAPLPQLDIVVPEEFEAGRKAGVEFIQSNLKSGKISLERKGDKMQATGASKEFARANIEAMKVTHTPSWAKGFASGVETEARGLVSSGEAEQYVNESFIFKKVVGPVRVWHVGAGAAALALGGWLLSRRR